MRCRERKTQKKESRKHHPEGKRTTHKVVSQPKGSGNGTYVCVCVCVAIPFILDVRLGDVPAGVIQEEGLRPPSAVLALFFIARRIQPSFSLVDREVEFCVPTN